MNGNSPGPNSSDDRLVIGALVGIAAASLLAWASGEASGMVAHLAVPHVPLGLAPRLLFGLVAHPSAPESAWPGRYRSQIGPGWLVVLFLMVLPGSLWVMGAPSVEHAFGFGSLETLDPVGTLMVRCWRHVRSDRG